MGAAKVYFLSHRVPISAVLEFSSHPNVHHYLVISPVICQMNSLISLINPINDNGFYS